jgi:hypothetical protein
MLMLSSLPKPSFDFVALSWFICTVTKVACKQQADNTKLMPGSAVQHAIRSHQHLRVLFVPVARRAKITNVTVVIEILLLAVLFTPAEPLCS